ncbi:MAG: hypothetical protein V4536_08690 [Pseudomonadota bacterium]
MQTYSANDFCSIESGIKYLFARMGAIYGASFTRHWEGVDELMIRQTWGELLGVYATYRPSMDFALKHMGKFVPSAIEFKDLCKQAGRIPSKPHSMITKQPTQAELATTAVQKEKALADWDRFLGKVAA